VHVWLERERERLQAQMLAHVHGTPGAPPEEPVLTPAPRQALRRSMQRLARRDRQAYTVLRMHVVRGISVDEIAALQGMSRSAVYRCLTRAKAECYKVYRASIAMERHRATGEQRPQTMRDF
jgi:DNA-directed RNA polymerase specialized sigma24 family protein